MIGKNQWPAVGGRWSVKAGAGDHCPRCDGARNRQTCLLTANHRPPTTGFTLLELLIVMSIIVILAAVVLPLYQQHVHRAREVTLRASLNEMRRVIDLYASDKGRFPQSPDDLVSAGYLREIPVDPVTGERDWRFETGSDPNFSQDAQGITNVRSSSSEISSEGTPYSEW